MPNHVIHIGFHKTASTWLQQSVFPDVQGALYVSRHPVLGTLLADLLEAEVFLESTFREAVREVGQRLLVSNEALVGHPWSESLGPDVLSERLARVLPGARIIVVTRERSALVRSLYAQYVYRGGSRRLEEFERDVLHPEYLDVDRTLEAYRSRFDAVLSVPYEELRADTRAVLQRMAEFAALGFPEPSARRANVSLSGWRLETLRRWNGAFRASALGPQPWVRLPRAGSMRKVLKRA